MIDSNNKKNRHKAVLEQSGNTQVKRYLEVCICAAETSTTEI